MKLVRALSEVEAKKVQSFILFGGVLTTLAIWTKLEDPINLPKMFVLVLFAAIVLGLSLPALLSARKPTSGSQRTGLALIGLFVIGLLISTIATDVKYTAIFGEYHRNNGFLSYLAMAIFLMAGLQVFKFESSNRYFKFFGLTGLVLTVYGFLQGAGFDPVGWVIDYNPYITTLGNPNFTSGLLGLAGVAILYLALDANTRNRQLIYGAGLLGDVYILFKTGSIQGLFGFVIGAAIITIVKLWILNKKYGQVGLLAAGLIGAPVALAILNVGPLASKLYQGTLRNRLDYWHAAFSMFKDHPIFGVGIDRFGEYYRQYAVQNQVVQGQITDNAHSVYMQLLATGGLLTFLPYIALIVFITFVGFRSLLITKGQEKLKVAGIFGIWVGTILVNIVTIDNLGVGVWFWITGGILLAISSEKVELQLDSTSQTVKPKGKRSISSNSKTEFPSSYVAAFLVVVIALIALVPVLGKSTTLYNLKHNLSSYTTQTYVPTLIAESKKAQNDPQYLIQLANLAFTQNAPNDAFQMINQINKIDLRSYNGNYFAAYAYEALNKRSEAIKYRERLKVLDPWNNASLIELIKDYLSVGNKDSATAIAALIKQNYPESQSAKDAAALLVR